MVLLFNSRGCQGTVILLLKPHLFDGIGMKQSLLVITDVEITVSLFNFTKFLTFKQVQTVILPFNNQILNF
jgi:hypothetical protein